MADEEPAELVFRASKRRRILRKPTTPDVQDDTPSPIERADVVISEQRSEDETGGLTGVVQARRRGGAGKGGIGFSSAGIRRVAEPEPVDDRSVAIVEESGTLQLPGQERFVPPTGRVGPTEDKHMIAYVDSKLAEFRPSVDKLPVSSNDPVEANPLQDGTTIDSNENEKDASSAAPPAPPTSGARTYQRAQERSSRAYQRPTRRKLPPARKEMDVARDSMIEQIMGESHVPHYEHAVVKDPKEDSEGVDHDAAAAEAFKAQLLADLETNRRRPPLSKSTATASTGPKLGGSRSQREKMKAMEEAKANSSKK